MAGSRNQPTTRPKAIPRTVTRSIGRQYQEAIPHKALGFRGFRTPPHIGQCHRSGGTWGRGAYGSRWRVLSTRLGPFAIDRTFARRPRLASTLRRLVRFTAQSGQRFWFFSAKGAEQSRQTFSFRRAVPARATCSASDLHRGERWLSTPPRRTSESPLAAAGFLPRSNMVSRKWSHSVAGR